MLAQGQSGIFFHKLISRMDSSGKVTKRDTTKISHGKRDQKRAALLLFLHNPSLKSLPSARHCLTHTNKHSMGKPAFDRRHEN